MNFTKLLTSSKEKLQGMSNQAFTLAEKSSCIKWQNSTETIAELAHVKWTLAKPVNTKMQIKTI